MRIDLAFDALLPHPVDAVWAAITSADGISGWLMTTTDFRPEVGARFRMRTQHLAPSGWVEAQVLELDPPRRMVWSWSARDAYPPTTVTFALAPEAGGTRLTLTHVGEIDPDIAAVMRSGWPGRIALIEEVAR
jgi:uncharacterized protein YndB with AHSA1/START domain